MIPNPGAEIPERIESEEQLDEIMTRPRPALIEFIKTLKSPLVLLGAAGKMGPSLAVLARRAAEAAESDLKIIAVSRFSSSDARTWLESRGVQTIARDLLERDALRPLPDSENVVYLVGLKFGTQQNPSLTWAVNTLVPTHVVERYRGSRMVALSTGNVYPLSPVSGLGSVETDSLTPLGEYCNAAVARERLFEYSARKHGTPLAVLRLNYAVDLRYGVLLEIAQKVWAGAPVDVTTGCLNCLWQGDANEMILRSLGLAAAPPAAFNLTGAARLSVRELALRFGELMSRPVEIVGREAETALLSNSARLCAALGAPATSLELLLKWTAHWVMQGGKVLGKPTRFEVRDGKF
jgi:nucleoside-diphosphate-sugar epimerase